MMGKLATILLAVTTLCASAVIAEPPPLTPQEEIGRQIYRHGASPSGLDILAQMGDSGIDVPAATLPCGSCHGVDGRGRPEGGLAPSDLRWEALTKPYGVVRASGREHPPYTDPLLKRAITLGLDAGDNELHVAMPRYSLSQDDMAALLAYLKRLGNEPQPGVSAQTLRLGTVLPPAGQLDPLGDAIHAVIEAGIAEVNQQGGIFGRQVVLSVRRLPVDATTWAESIVSFVEKEEIFALVGAYISGQDKAISQALDEQSVPLIGPFTSDPRNRFPLPRSVFYLLPGPTEQGRALLDFALADQQAGEGASQIAVLYTEDDPAMRSAAEFLLKESEGSLHAVAFDRLTFQAGQIVDDLRQRQMDDLLFLGSSQHLQALLTAATAADWSPHLLTTAHLTTPIAEASAGGFAGSAVLAFPTLPRDLSPLGRAEYQQLSDTYGLPTHHRLTQMATLAGVKLLVEGLRQVGRDLTRDRLVTTMEGFRKVITGVLPPLSYNANRRIGTGGVWVARFDPAARKLEEAQWLEVE